MATINVKPGMKLLDLGCGSGYLTFPIAKMNEKSIIDSYQLTQTEDEIWVTEQVNNLLFQKQ